MNYRYLAVIREYLRVNGARSGVDRSLVEVAMAYPPGQLRSEKVFTGLCSPVFWDYLRGAQRRTASAIGRPTKNM